MSPDSQKSISKLLFKTTKLFFLLFITAVSGIIQAQESKVQWQKPIKTDKFFFPNQIEHINENEYFLFIMDMKNYKYTAVEAYKDGELVSTLDLKSSDKRVSIQGLIFDGTNIQVISKFKDSIANKTEFTLQLFNPELKKLKEVLLFSEVAKNKVFDYHIRAISSPDKSKRLFVVESRSSDQRVHMFKRYNMLILDNTGEKISEKTITRNGYNNFTVELFTLALTRNSDIMIVEQHAREGNNQRKYFYKSGGNYIQGLEYKSLVLKNGTDEFIEDEIKVQKGIIREIYANLNPETNSLMFAGVYLNSSNPNARQGTFMVEISLSGRATTKYEQDFTPDFLKSFAVNKMSIPKEGFSSDFTPTALLRREDGGYYFVIEYSSQYVHSFEFRISDYSYGDIALVSVKPDGTFDWNLRIPKFQASKSREIARSSFFIHNNNLMIINNEQPQFVNQSEAILKGNYSDSYLALREITPDGKMNKKLLFKLDSDNLLMSFFSKVIGNNRLRIVESTWNKIDLKSIRLGFIPFE